MRKILLSILCFICFSNTSFAEFSEKEELLFETYTQKAEDIVWEKWEAYREYIVYTLKEFIERTDVREKTADFIKHLATKIEENKWKITWPVEYQELWIEIESVKASWLSWVNEERDLVWVSPYSYHKALEKTALKWSTLSKDKGYIDHKVSVWDSYYNYTKKAKWMKDNGIVCKNLYGVTFTESIGWGMFSCHDDNCTQELTNGIQSSFDFFMSEKWKSYKPHYEAIAGKYFTIMGLGIEIEKIGTNRYKYYLTNHYCTELQ